MDKLFLFGFCTSAFVVCILVASRFAVFDSFNVQKACGFLLRGSTGTGTVQQLPTLPAMYSIPPTFHILWTANPLKPYALASIDSIARYSPDSKLNIHVVPPVNTSEAGIEAIRGQLQMQLSAFAELDRFSIEVAIHDNVSKYFQGTPLEGLDFKQEHLGGTIQISDQANNIAFDRQGTPFGDHHLALLHASDMMRLTVLYKEGGIYLDSDVMLLEDIVPLVQSMGSFILCETRAKGQPDGRCKLVNALMAFPPRHPFLKQALEEVPKFIEEYSIESLFNVHGNKVKQAYKTILGPALVSTIKNDWIDNRKDVWVIDDQYPNYADVKQRRHRPTISSAEEQFPNTTSVDTSVTILGRQYFFSTMWNEETLDQDASMTYSTQYSGVYSVHLWEMGKTSENLIRPNFLQLIKSEKTLMAYLYRKSCLVFCKPDTLELAATLRWKTPTD